MNAPLSGLAPHEIGSITRGEDGRTVLVQQRMWAVEPATLWAALTDPRYTPAWLGELDAPLSGAGTVRIDHGGGATSEVVVRDVDPGRSVDTSWRTTGEGRADVRIEIGEPAAAHYPSSTGSPEVGREVDDAPVQVLLTLTYACDDEEQVRSALGGWFGFLDALGDLFEQVPETGVGSPALRAIQRLAAAVELGRMLPVG
ncbi:SRPBCC domain-containing protein [Georgenia sp. Z1491]|uniref:SRPBCC domain-containing protein n=1 Tax=Georgenia sp. Z1491 TaxID=3416707 RepID=UPI003CEFFA57